MSSVYEWYIRWKIRHDVGLRSFFYKFAWCTGSGKLQTRLSRRSSLSPFGESALCRRLPGWHPETVNWLCIVDARAAKRSGPSWFDCEPSPSPITPMHKIFSSLEY